MKHYSDIKKSLLWLLLPLLFQPPAFLWAASEVSERRDGQRSSVESYRKMLEQNIHKQWAPKTFPETKQATVRFILNREGQLMGLRMKKGSGVPALDESIQEAVIAAAPFEKLPREISGEEAAFEFTFDYVPPQ